ncbi:hypothetical protein SLS55_007374 [Diplodia seriata]|uniref:DUF7962 domain-containing protein n=1 Tax=Diplodia seriata TaxID=420778 RepID=A0ABR3CEN4_9PEZI
MPRPDLDQLGIAYRRIPLMTIGRDVYCDTRLILRKLEERFPDGKLGASGSDQKAIERLLDRWTTDAGVFSRAATLIPSDMPALRDPKFAKDREDFSGRSWSREAMQRARPESVVYVRDAFALLEHTLLADGREWILKTPAPSLADIEEQHFPKVYAWIKRFREALRAAQSSGPKPVTLKGPQAVSFVSGANLAESGGHIDAADPLGLEKGQEVEVWPIDSGFKHHDRGTLVSLTPDEMVLASRTRAGDDEVHIHFPRWGFRIVAARGAAAKL